jgi:4-diphosphocytidyl-2C-methyl-D-erythritol kinase
LPFRSRKVTLITPDFGVNTGDCYRAYDELLHRGWEPKEDRNHLEKAARLVEPRMGRTIDWVRSEIADDVHLAGSGSTMFVIGEVLVPDGQLLGPEGPLQFRQTVTTPG